MVVNAEPCAGMQAVHVCDDSRCLDPKLSETRCADFLETPLQLPAVFGEPARAARLRNAVMPCAGVYMHERFATVAIAAAWVSDFTCMLQVVFAGTSSLTRRANSVCSCLVVLWPVVSACGAMQSVLGDVGVRVRVRVRVRVSVAGLLRAPHVLSAIAP